MLGIAKYDDQRIKCPDSIRGQVFLLVSDTTQRECQKRHCSPLPTLCATVSWQKFDGSFQILTYLYILEVHHQMASMSLEKSWLCLQKKIFLDQRFQGLESAWDHDGEHTLELRSLYLSRSRKTSQEFDKSVYIL